MDRNFKKLDPAKIEMLRERASKLDPQSMRPLSKDEIAKISGGSADPDYVGIPIGWCPRCGNESLYLDDSEPGCYVYFCTSCFYSYGGSIW